MKKEKAAKTDKAPQPYTVTEVGTLLESIHKEIRTIGEGHSDLDRRLERVEIEVHGLVDKFPIIEISHRVLNDKVSRFEMALSKFNKDLKDEITGVKEELKGEIAEVRKEFKGEMGEVRNEVGGIRNEVIALKTDLAEVKTELVAVKTELKKEIRDLGERLTSVESPP